MSPRQHEAGIKDLPMSTTDDIYRMWWMTSIYYNGPWDKRPMNPIVMLLEGGVELSPVTEGEREGGGPGGKHTAGDTMYMQGGAAEGKRTQKRGGGGKAEAMTLRAQRLKQWKCPDHLTPIRGTTWTLWVS
jgi:hypothetical protein